MQWLKDLIERAETYYGKDNRGAAECVWTIMTALRGPDYHPPDDTLGRRLARGKLKRLTTARVRSLVGMSESRYGVTTNEKPLTDQDIMLRFGLLTNEHFKDHISGAYDELKKLGYDIPEVEMDFVGLP